MAWLRLLRIAALPSALSNVLVGFLLAQESWHPKTSLVWLLIASCCLYLAGMVLNDVFDIEVDRKERPSRPLPSGKIALSSARKVGYTLLVAGPVLALLVSSVSLLIAVFLAILVFLYDGPLKRTAVAPLLMGACRSLNILMGASAADAIPGIAIWYSIAIGTFVAGITLFARNESREQQPVHKLIPGGVVMFSGLALLVFVVWHFAGRTSMDPEFARFLPLAICFICLPVLRRLVLALVSTSGSSIQAAVVTSLRSLIIFDACVALLIENGRPYHSFALLSLLAVSWLLGRFTKLT